MTSEEKIKDFLEKYGKLTKECGVDFISYPMFVPDKEGKFSVVVNTQAVEVKGKTLEDFISK